MKILLAVDGSTGDVAPVFLLAKHLKAIGHTAVMAAPIDFQADAARHEISFESVGGPIRNALEKMAQSIDRGGIAFLRETQTYAAAAIEHQFKHLPKIARGFDLMVTASLQFAGSSVAEKLGIPHRFLAFSPRIFPTATMPPVVIEALWTTPWINRLSWRAIDVLHDLSPIGRGINKHRRQMGLVPWTHCYRHHVENAILAADEILFPLPADAGHVERLPSLTGVEDAPLPPAVEDFLAQGPAMYLGFGSMPDHQPEKTWQMIVSAAKQSRVRLLVGSGWANLTGNSVDLASQIMAIGPVSHARLFKKVTGVVHHGGAGTTTLAARSGKPQWVIPHLLDQFYHGDRVYNLGLGPVPVKRRELSQDLLSRGLTELTQNQVFAENASELAPKLQSDLRGAIERVFPL